MKKLILLIVLFSINHNIFSQENLYLVFDENTPVITKDIGKYIGWNEVIMKDLSIYKSTNTPYLYFYEYPLFAGQSLRLTKKENTSVQTISLSEVSNYPAMTIMELDTEMQPLIEADYSNPLTDSWGRGEIRTISYFAAFEHIYVIELDPDNNQAYIVEVIIDITR
jgi:hypothetical protein